VTAHSTYILSCDGEGCNQLYGRSPKDELATTVREHAAADGWTRESLLVMVRGERPYYMPADFCPACALKRLHQLDNTLGSVVAEELT